MEKTRILSCLDHTDYFCAKARILRGLKKWMTGELKLQEARATVFTDILLMKNFEQEPFLSILEELSHMLCAEGYRIKTKQLIDKSFALLKKEKATFSACCVAEAI